MPLPALAALHINTLGSTRCHLPSLPGSVRSVRLRGKGSELYGGCCPINPDLTVVAEGKYVVLDISNGWVSGRHARASGTVLQLAAYLLRLDSDWLERHPGQQPSAAVILVDCVMRQPFAEVAFWQERRQQPLEVQCKLTGPEADDVQWIMETFDSLQQLHAACHALTLQAGASCNLTTGSTEPAFILTFRPCVMRQAG